MRLGLAAAASALAACATAYQPESTNGGYSEIQAEKRVWIVSFRGNGFTEPARVQDFALLRACEVVLAAGCTHYRIIDVASGSTFGGVVVSGNAYSATGVPINKPTSQIGVTCADAEQGLDASAQAAAIRAKYGID